MDLRLQCENPACRQRVVLDAAQVLQDFPCPKCGQLLHVPANGGTDKTGTLAQGDQDSNWHDIFKKWSCWAKRAGIGWAMGAALFGLLLGLLKLWHWQQLPGKTRVVLDELCAVGEFRGAPVSNHAGDKILYARNEERGVGIYMLEVPLRQSHQVELIDAVEHSEFEFFMLHGWSPDDQTLLFSTTFEPRHFNRQLMVCDGVTGKLKQSLTLDNSIREAVWLNNVSAVLIDRLGGWYVLNLADNKQLGTRGKRGLVRLGGSSSKRDVQGLNKLDATTVLYAQGEQVWRYNIADGARSSMSFAPAGELEWLDHDRETKALLFSSQGKDASGNRELWQANWNGKAWEPAQRSSTNHTFKGRWLVGKQAKAWVDTPGSRNALVVEQEGWTTNLFSEGSIRSYAVTPDRKKLLCFASPDSSPHSLWQYDTGTRELSQLVTATEAPFADAAVLPMEFRLTTNQYGKEVHYYLVTPPSLVTGRRYPLYLDNPTGGRWDPHAQALAQTGIFYASASQRGLASFDDLSTAEADLLAMAEDLKRHPAVDPARVFLGGHSAGTSIVCRLAADHPELWRGYVLNGPVAMPKISQLKPDWHSVFISIGDNDREYRLRMSDEFTAEATAACFPVRMIVHEHAGHRLTSTRLVRERGEAMIRYINSSGK